MGLSYVSHLPENVGVLAERVDINLSFVSYLAEAVVTKRYRPQYGKVPRDIPQLLLEEIFGFVVVFPTLRQQKSS
ncbi:hypothetical protein [Thermococcus sp.]